MKKYLLIPLLLVVIVATAMSAQEYDERLDMNRDGKLTIADITALVNYIMSKDSSDDERYDANQDGKVSIADVKTLVNHILDKDSGNGKPAKLTIHFADGTSRDIQLSTTPRITFDGDNIVLTTPEDEYSYNAQDVLLFTYSGEPLAYSPSASPQNIGEAFYVYRNDGGFNAFFREEVDSMAYSRYDADSALHANIVTQEVYTQDSIYQIPLAAIDSVSFVTPETVYKPGVIQLEGEILNYITACDSLTISFLLDTPSWLLPCVGDKLVTDKVSDLFPIGFAGQVTEIRAEDGKLKVICTKVDLEDIYEYYYYVSSNEVSDVSYVKAMAGERDVVREWEKSKTLGPFTYTLTDIATPQIYPDPMGDLYFQYANHQSVTVTPTFRVKCVRIISPEMGTIVSLDVTEEDEVNEDFSMSGSIGWSHDFSLFPIPVKIELGIPFLQMYFDLGAFLSAKGSVSIDQHFWQTYRTSFHCEVGSRSYFIPRMSLNSTRVESGHEGNVMLNGTFAGGLYCGLGIEFIDKSLIGIGIREQGGIEIEGGAMLYRKDAEEALHSTNLYKSLLEDRITVKGFVEASIPAKFLWLGWENVVARNDRMIAEGALVPTFADTKLERDPEDASVLYAESKATGMTLPVDLGFKLFEQESTKEGGGGLTAYGYTGPRADLYSSFYNMPTDKKYEVYPTVKLLGLEMLAEPKAEEHDGYCPDDNHPHAIDLGLPSGTKWCCCNVGASKPEDYGGYYAWGETSEKSVYNEVTYSYFNGQDTNGDGWINKNFSVVNIGSDIAGTSYDVAHVRMGAPWRMPSTEQQQELIDNCSRQWTTQNGVNGILVTGPSGGQVFLPAAGYRWCDDLRGAGSAGVCWSSSLHPDYDFDAYRMNFFSGGWYWNYYDRYLGLSVRAVCP